MLIFGYFYDLVKSFDKKKIQLLGIIQQYHIRLYQLIPFIE